MKTIACILLGALLTCCLFVSQAGASGSAPAVSAGVDKAIAFPQTDMTLFGQATDPENDPLTVTWSQVSGPAGATMSASWALANTITFTNTGTYVFRLTVFDGTNTVTDDMTATVASQASQTEFYVDPTYTGGTQTGSAAQPWTTLSFGASGNARWNTINTALASNNVIIYFSARKAGSDTPEVETQSLNLWRTNTSTNRLTLDGMSRYNTNDASPAWAAYSGANKFNVAIASGSVSIGVQTSFPTFPMHYTTVRGFNVSGNTGRLLVAGNYVDIEYIDSHDVTGQGGTIQLQNAWTDFQATPSCAVLFGRLTDIAFRHNTVVKSFGEGYYMGGTYQTTAQGGCPTLGNTHSNLLLENNTAFQIGWNGGQGDMIDLKAGLQWVTVRGNTLTDCYTGSAGNGAGYRNDCRGIASDGTFSAGPNFVAGATYVLEGNRISGCLRCMYLILNHDITVRNNIAFNAAQHGLATDTITRLFVYNNTFYNNGDVGFGIGNVTGGQSRNNLSFGNNANGAQAQMSGSTGVTNNFNGYGVGGPAGNMAEGAQSKNFGTNSGLVTNAAAGDFTLPVGSPALDVGTSLATTGFAVDIDRNPRPQGSGWDMGAYERASGATPSPPVLNSIRFVPRP